MHVLVKIAKKYIAQADSTWAAQMKTFTQSDSKRDKTGVNTWGLEDEEVQKVMEKRKHGGNCLFPFAMVCQEWRKAQQKVGGQMRMRADADVLLWGRVELAAWALREGECVLQSAEVQRLTPTHTKAARGRASLSAWKGSAATSPSWRTLPLGSDTSSWCRRCARSRALR